MEGKCRFIDVLNELADYLEHLTIRLMKNEMEEYNKEILNLSRLLEICFPQIIITYADPLLSEVAGDSAYWSEQLGRIIEALRLDDKFIRIDVLYQETRTNLLAFMDMIKDTPLAEVMLDEPQMLKINTADTEK